MAIQRALYVQLRHYQSLDVVYNSILCDYLCPRGLWVITSTVQPAGLSMILRERPRENISEFKDFT